MAVKITLENEHYDSVCVPKTISKTMEERANKFALNNHPYSPFYEEYTKMYIDIATEQKAIDDELSKRVLKGVIDNAIREKKEAAMKAYCKRCQDMGGGYPCSHKCYEYIEYAKTLEK